VVCSLDGVQIICVLVSVSRKTLEEAFANADKDGSGSLTTDEIRTLTNDCKLHISLDYSPILFFFFYYAHCFPL